jgi:hypothetical protein
MNIDKGDDEGGLREKRREGLHPHSRVQDDGLKAKAEAKSKAKSKIKLK